MEDKDRKKVMIAARERGPGPGRYALPSSVGFKTHDFTKHMKPAYSFGHRLDNSMFSKDVSPGPKYHVSSRFTRVGPEGEPKYSMLARQPEPNLFRPPGPGTYDNHRVHPQGERHAPKYSMAARTRFRKRDANPAANAYTLPQLIGPKIINKKAQSAYSMTGRSKINGFDEDLARTPGPAKYNVTVPNCYRNRQPLYSMLGRNVMPGDNTRKPGPGAHSPEKVYINKTKAPVVSMDLFQTPGPGTYKPETVHPPNERRAPRYSLSARTRSRSLDHFPAPNMYRIPSALGSHVPNRRSSPSFSISGRLSVRNFAEDLAKTPGPAQYRPIPPRNYKRSSPEYSLGARNFMPGDATKKPGPGAHSPGRAFGSLWRGRSFSMGIRHSEYLTPLIIDVAD